MESMADASSTGESEQRGRGPRYGSGEASLCRSPSGNQLARPCPGLVRGNRVDARAPFQRSGPLDLHIALQAARGALVVGHLIDAHVRASTRHLRRS